MICYYSTLLWIHPTSTIFCLSGCSQGRNHILKEGASSLSFPPSLLFLHSPPRFTCLPPLPFPPLLHLPCLFSFLPCPSFHFPLLPPLTLPFSLPFPNAARGPGGVLWAPPAGPVGAWPTNAFKRMPLVASLQVRCYIFSLQVSSAVAVALGLFRGMTTYSCEKLMGDVSQL